MEKVDSHQHFWKFDPVRDNWITEEMEVIAHDFLPSDLEPLLHENGLSACIAVQADQSEKETVFLLNLAKENAFIKAVVGWVDLCSPQLPVRLEYFNKFKNLKGFRHIVQAEPIGFMLRPEFRQGISALSRYGYTYDILIYPHQIPDAIELVKSHPEQAFVLDHLAKPDIKNAEIKTWAKQMEQLASFGNLYCKLSGMLTEADLQNWKEEDIQPYMDQALELFGAKRLMFGSDWPVCKLAADYGQVCQVVADYLQKLSLSEQEMIWGKNAAEFYKFN